MILFDANVLIELSSAETSEAKERIQGLVSELSLSKTVIGIPAPAWAEYLCGSGALTNALSAALRSLTYVRILPFDDISAYEAALLHQEIMEATGAKKAALCLRGNRSRSIGRFWPSRANIVSAQFTPAMRT